LRLLFLSPVGTLGGAERSLVDLLAALRESEPKFPISVIAGADGPLREEIEQLGAEFEVVSMPDALASLGESGLLWSGVGRIARTASLALQASRAAFQVPGLLRRMRRAVSRHKPDLIHSNGLKCHLLAGYVAPREVPVVWHIRDFLTSRPLLGRWLRRLGRPPSVAIANSEATAADVRSALPGVRVERIYNGIDTEYFLPGSSDSGLLDRLAGLGPAPPNAIRVGLVATYARWKGQDLFIDAAAAVKGDLTPIRYYIVGGPTYSTAGSQFSVAELRERIAERGLSECVGLIPFQKDLPPVYRGLDVVVHASTRPEPFGRTIVEAMACGRAAIVSAAGGAVELFTDGVDALGVQPGNVEQLAAAVRRLVDDPKLCRRLGDAARATAVERFNANRSGAELDRVYRSILPKNAPE
jgi:glycosyltransferase involved in cell wall biosynthesis